MGQTCKQSLDLLNSKYVKQKLQIIEINKFGRSIDTQMWIMGMHNRSDWIMDTHKSTMIFHIFCPIMDLHNATTDLHSSIINLHQLIMELYI